MTGDSGFKLLRMGEGHEPQVLADVPLSIPLVLGHRIDFCAWDANGRKLVVVATDGHLWAYEVEEVIGVEMKAGANGNGEASTLVPGMSNAPKSRPDSRPVPKDPSLGLTAAYRI